MDSCTLSWLAGWLEGEGTFGTIRKSTPYISGTSTDYDALERVRILTGTGSIIKLKKRKQHWKDAWKWCVAGRVAAALMTQLLPLMCTRRSSKIKEVLVRYDNNKKLNRKKYEKIVESRIRVKELHAIGAMTHKMIAAQLQISRSYVSHILRGKYDNRNIKWSLPF